MTDALSSKLADTFDAISILLVFVTVLFGLRYPQIQAQLNVPSPAGPVAKRNLIEQLWTSLLVNCFPLLVVNGAVAYLTAPLMYAILKTSDIHFLDFDFLRSAFFVIALLLYWFFGWALWLTNRMVRCRSTLKEELKKEEEEAAVAARQR